MSTVKFDGFAAMLNFLEHPGPYQPGDQIIVVVKMVGKDFALCDVKKRSPQLKAEDLSITLERASKLKYGVEDPDNVLDKASGFQHRVQILKGANLIEEQGSSFDHTDLHGEVWYKAHKPGTAEVEITVGDLSVVVKVTVTEPAPVPVSEPMASDPPGGPTAAAAEGDDGNAAARS